MPDMKPARLTDEALKEIKALEERLGGVCLLAVEKSSAMFAVEIKEGPNDWRPIHQAFPEIDRLRSFYQDRDDAEAAKAALKSLLIGKPEYQPRKRPIRVRKIG